MKHLPEYQRLKVTPIRPDEVLRKTARQIPRAEKSIKNKPEPQQQLHEQPLPSFFVKAQNPRDEIFEEEIEIPQQKQEEFYFNWNEVEVGKFVIFIDAGYIVLDQKEQVEEYIESLCREPPFPEFSLENISVVQKIPFKFGISLI